MSRWLRKALNLDKGSSYEDYEKAVTEEEGTDVDGEFLKDNDANYGKYHDMLLTDEGTGAAPKLDAAEAMIRTIFKKKENPELFDKFMNEAINTLGGHDLYGFFNRLCDGETIKVGDANFDKLLDRLLKIYPISAPWILSDDTMLYEYDKIRHPGNKYYDKIKAVADEYERNKNK